MPREVWRHEARDSNASSLFMPKTYGWGYDIDVARLLKRMAGPDTDRVSPVSCVRPHDTFADRLSEALERVYWPRLLPPAWVLAWFASVGAGWEDQGVMGAPMAVRATVFDLNGRPHYVHSGWFLISDANLIVIITMVVVFVLAVVLPFPRGRKRR